MGSMVDPKASAIILAGGKSTRLGRDKASELLLGVPLLQRVVSQVAPLAAEVVVVSAAGQALPAIAASVPVSMVEDTFAESGPLGGIYTGLRAITTRVALTVACDMPLLQPSLLTQLLMLATVDYDAVVPTNDMYLPEPLCAVYSTRCLDAIVSQVGAGALKVALFFDKVRVRYVPPSEWRTWDPEGLSFLNVNRETDLHRAEALLR
jgi:molybdopterin-guanine dinucleotide biosynthesis protein A